MRISEWATKFNAIIEPAKAKPGETYYRVRDLFTTRDGSWEPSNKPGSVPQWARDTYLHGTNHPQYNSDGGADHHIFGAVADGANLKPLGNITFWTPDYNGNMTIQRVKTHGWANSVIDSSFVPERGERGPWAWQPSPALADIVIGGGLPANMHVSWFCVWEAFTMPPVIVPPIDPPIEPGDDGDYAALRRDIDGLQRVVAGQTRLIADMAALLSKWSGGK